MTLDEGPRSSGILWGGVDGRGVWKAETGPPLPPGEEPGSTIGPVMAGASPLDGLLLYRLCSVSRMDECRIRVCRCNVCK